MTPGENTNTLPRPPLFKAIVLGLIAFSLLGTIVTTMSRATTPYMGPSWMPALEWLFAGGANVGLVSLWFRRGWAFYLLCGLALIKVAFIFAIAGMAGIPIILIEAVCLALLVFGLHSGGAGSMWRQMFGSGASFNAGSGAYGFSPALPPQMHVPPAAAAPLPVPPAPAPPVAAASVDAFEQIKRLAALRDAGVLTTAEFDAKKIEMLRRL